MIWVNGKGRSILVVEDEPAISEVCVRTLIGEGFQVKVVSNGNAALDVLAEKEYDLCLIDLRTPEMDGVELYARLKQQHPGMVDRVIFTTGDVLSDNIKTFLETAGRPCLPKPFTPDELRIIVRTVPAPG
ncbi:MAG: DNA-binding heavy metal response regulator [Dehalococcoidia bacterium]|nr:DNA-binding heavy metal response regulator [Dehalococcoidia bacterium]